MEIKFYPYDFEYKIKEEKTYVYLYSKLKDGSRICVIHKHEPFFFVDIGNLNSDLFEDITIESAGKIAKIVSWEKVKKELLGKEKEYWKLVVNFPKAVQLISKKLNSLGLNCYETDIFFTHRYIRDMGITPMTEVIANGDFIDDLNMRVPVFSAENVKQGSKQVLHKWKFLALDIETYAVKKEINPEKNPILMVAVYGIDEKDKSFKKSNYLEKVFS